MGKVVVPNAVQRRPGFIYYVDGKGNVCEAVSAVGKGRKPSKKKAKAKAAKPTTKKTVTKKAKKK